MNKRRLLKLADLLEADAKNKKGMQFDIDRVGSVSEYMPKKVELNCGTTGCAMGLAAMSGAFKRQGLGHKCTGFYVNTTWKGRSVQYDSAARRLFGISTNDAQLLFSPGSYDGPQRGAEGERSVAKRIRDFVAGTVSAA